MSNTSDELLRFYTIPLGKAWIAPKHRRAVRVITLIKEFAIEDRIYRLRCVEAWSMVIPWQGFSLNQLINKVRPFSDAKYVEFENCSKHGDSFIYNNVL